MEETPDLNLDEVNMSRREFLGYALRSAVDKAYLPSLVAPYLPEQEYQPTYEEQITAFPFEQYPAQETELIPQENKYFDFETTEHVLNLPGMGWYPDGRIPFITQPDGSKLMWITGHMNGAQGSYPYTWSPQDGLNQYMPNGYFAPSVARNQVDNSEYYRNGYAGLTSVLRMGDGTLLGFTHNEQWEETNNGGGFRASVGIVVSKDGGATFVNAAGRPVTGRKTITPGEEVSGAGQPCVINISDKHTGKNYAYIYYTEWLPDEYKKLTGDVDQVYLAKLKLNNGSIGEVQNFTEEGFKNVLYDNLADLKPVISQPKNIWNSGYAALASISFNKDRQKLLAIYETNVGVCAAESVNGIDWNDHQLVLKYPLQLSSVWANPGSTTYSYPSIVDFSQVNDNFTGENLTMFLAKGIGAGASHSMVALKVKRKP